MPAAEQFQGFACWAHAPLLYILNPLTDSLERLGLSCNIKQALIRFGILHDRFGLSVDGEDKGLLGFLKTLYELRGIPAESSHCLNIFFDVKHRVRLVLDN